MISSRYSDDVEYLVKLAASDWIGVTLTPEEAYTAWSAYSKTSAANWLMLEEEEEWNASYLRSGMRIANINGAPLGDPAEQD